MYDIDLEVRIQNEKTSHISHIHPERSTEALMSSKIGLLKLIKTRTTIIKLRSEGLLWYKNNLWPHFSASTLLGLRLNWACRSRAPCKTRDCWSQRARWMVQVVAYWWSKHSYALSQFENGPSKIFASNTSSSSSSSRFSFRVEFHIFIFIFYVEVGRMLSLTSTSGIWCSMGILTVFTIWRLRAT